MYLPYVLLIMRVCIVAWRCESSWLVRGRSIDISFPNAPGRNAIVEAVESV